MNIFGGQKHDFLLNAFFIIIDKKTNFVEKSFSAFEGAPFKPLKHTMTFFPQNVLNLVLNIHEKCI